MLLHPGALARYALLLAFGATIAAAQQPWPSKPVRVIVPIAAGGVTDIVVRAASREVSARIGQTLVVDNRAGANGIVGAEACARAMPDGYTICIINTGITSANPEVYDKLPFDPVRDLVPVGNLYTLTGVIVVPVSLPVNSVGELRALINAKLRPINFGTMGPGSYPEMFVAWLNSQWKSDLIGIPYKGGAPVAVALAAGEVQVSAAALGSFLGQLQGGQIKALAVSGSKRSRLLPNVPTYSEVGLGSFAGHMWWGIAGPVGMPPQIVSRINGEFAQLFREQKFIDFLESLAVQPAVGTTEQFAAFLKADREWIGALINSTRPRQR